MLVGRVFYVYRMKERRKTTHRKLPLVRFHVSHIYSGLKPSMRIRPPWPPDVPEPPVAFGGFAGRAWIGPEAAALFGAAGYGTCGGVGCFVVFGCYFTASGPNRVLSWRRLGLTTRTSSALSSS